MIFSSKHIKPLRLAFAALVFLASSGAAAVIRECKVEAMSCCAPVSRANHDDCDQPALPISRHSIKAQFTCHTTALVGGVAIKQALVEQQHKPELPKQIVFCIASSQSLLSAQTNRSSSTFFLTETVSPPTVEKYVLNGSFLI